MVCLILVDSTGERQNAQMYLHFRYRIRFLIWVKKNNGKIQTVQLHLQTVFDFLLNVTPGEFR